MKEVAALHSPRCHFSNSDFLQATVRGPIFTGIGAVPDLIQRHQVVLWTGATVARTCFSRSKISVVTEITYF